MKKNFLLCFLTLIFLLSGCSSKDTTALLDNANASTEPESVPDKTIQSSEYSASPNDQNQKQEITVTEQSESPSYYAKSDNTVVTLEITAVYPVITISNNITASDKINAAIKAELETFREFEKDHAAEAEKLYQNSLDSQSEFCPYTAGFSYTLKRCDEKILSVVFHQTDYTGGAHANSWSYGITFDSATGERLYLESLSLDYPKFYKTLLNELTAQAGLPAYQDYLYDGQDIDLEHTLLQDSSSWYLDRSGISFISNPYALGPYASGNFEFNIPYANLPELKETYSYKESYIRKLFPGTSAQHDLNGDGTADDICYAILADAAYADVRPSLTINGTDFSSEFDKLYLSYLYTGAYHLIDIDPEDNFVEIAISSENIDQPEKSSTHFFRYDASNKLTYLGNISGIFHDNMNVTFNSNGNLILADREGVSFEK